MVAKSQEEIRALRKQHKMEMKNINQQHMKAMEKDKVEHERETSEKRHKEEMKKLQLEVKKARTESKKAQLDLENFKAELRYQKPITALTNTSFPQGGGKPTAGGRHFAMEVVARVPQQDRRVARVGANIDFFGRFFTAATHLRNLIH
eukprot:TRINITY_DN2710_c0_g1_i1.p1 TRINITY_DN2710_c0_g1~~TRINITY_DN2710_c0_g1_i1.p1  ORF type:complete len:148 (+),score=32.79 TRINITY_DN2710_c0_g1_i1:344-787(+)